MMSLHSLSDEALVTLIHNYVQAHAIPLHGPAEIEYGFGWEPTLSFWFDSRRMHLYGDSRHSVQGLTIELAEVGPPAIVRCTEVNEPAELYTLLERFFGQQLALQAMTDVPWRSACLDHDKFIPHPPGAPNRANIIELIRHAEPWQPDAVTARAPRLLQRLRKFLERN